MRAAGSVSNARPHAADADRHLRRRACVVTVVVDGSTDLDAGRGCARRVWLSQTDRVVFAWRCGARLRAASFRSRHLELPDATIRYWRGGRGQPLIFVHGFGTEAAVNWYAQMLAFARDFDVIAPDLPGFGGSKRWSSENGIGLQVAVAARASRSSRVAARDARRPLDGRLDQSRFRGDVTPSASSGSWSSMLRASASSPDLTLERALLAGDGRRRPSVDPRQFPAARPTALLRPA